MEFDDLMLDILISILSRSFASLASSMKAAT